MTGALFHPLDCLLKKQVSAIALEGFAPAVVIVNIVKIIVVEIICGGGDMGRGKPDGFLKAAILRAIRVIVAEMPFAKEGGAIVVCCKSFRQDGKFPAHQRATAADI